MYSRLKQVQQAERRLACAHRFAMCLLGGAILAAESGDRVLYLLISLLIAAGIAVAVANAAYQRALADVRAADRDLL